MTNDKDVKNTGITPSRRKRINNIKTGIIIVILLAMILPMIFCIILARQVYKLNKRVEILIESHQDIEEIANMYNKSKYTYAYASEKELSDTKDDNLNNNTIDNKADTNKLDTINVVHNNEDNKLVKEPETDSKHNNEVEGKYAGKLVYLTFDDGPSIYTNDILDILAEYDVKATFFVNGKTDEASKEIYRRIVNEGHTLGMHSYSHDYGEIYNSLEKFEKDFTKLWKLLYDTTGYKPTIYRFPGGSLNYVNKNGMEEFIRFLGEKSIQYYDWNVENGDATGVDYTAEQLVDNVLDGVEKKDRAIVLMHDTRRKLKTVESLPELLDILLSEGAQVLPLDETVTPIQQIKASSID